MLFLHDNEETRYMEIIFPNQRLIYFLNNFFNTQQPNTDRIESYNSKDYYLLEKWKIFCIFHNATQLTERVRKNEFCFYKYLKLQIFGCDVIH